MKKILLLFVVLGFTKTIAQERYKRNLYFETINHPEAVFNNSLKNETEDKMVKIATAVFVAKTFTPYIYDKDFSISFGDIYNKKDRQLAISMGGNLDCKVEIILDRKKWVKLSQLQKFYLIWHELGHDVLNLDHMKTGIMREELPSRYSLTPESIFRDLDKLQRYTFKHNIYGGPKGKDIKDETCENQTYY